MPRSRAKRADDDGVDDESFFPHYIAARASPAHLFYLMKRRVCIMPFRRAACFAESFQTLSSQEYHGRLLSRLPCRPDISFHADDIAEHGFEFTRL